MRLSFFTFLFFSTSLLLAQVGGDNVYEFLNLSPSARVTALGGNLITVNDDDIALAYANPAALNPQMHQQLSFNYNFHFAGIGHGFAGFGQHLEKWGTTFLGGIQYINYGDFNAADERGNLMGTFKASEYALTIGVGKELYERLSVGANLKFVSSQLETYNSIGLVGDLAAMFHDTASLFNATLLFKNIGTQFTTYTDGNAEPIPFEIQLGISKRLKYLPLRFSIIGHNLQRWNILYDDPNAVDEVFIIGDTTPSENRFGMGVDNFFRHLIFNIELLFGKRENFRLRLGYNHFRRQELAVRNLRSFGGFSFGLGLKIKRFRIEYGRGLYHIAGGVNHLSIATNLKEFKKKK